MKVDIKTTVIKTLEMKATNLQAMMMGKGKIIGTNGVEYWIKIVTGETIFQDH